MKTVQPKDEVFATLSILKAALSGAGAPKIALCTNPIPLNPDHTIADIVLPTYTGYANSAVVTFLSVHMDDEGNAICWSNLVEFKPTAPGPEQVVTQVVLLDSAGTKILFSYVLPEPHVFVAQSDVLTVSFPLIVSQPRDTEETVMP